MSPEEARRRYQREWRAKNKDKVKEYEQRRWERLALKFESEQKLEGNTTSDGKEEKHDGGKD